MMILGLSLRMSGCYVHDNLIRSSSDIFVFHRELAKVMKKITYAIALGLAVALSSAASAGTLDTVKQRGHIQCGVNQGLPGFSNPDDKGNWSGLDVDFCRSLAAVVFGDATKVKFSPLSTKDRFTALQSGEVDVLARNTTWTASRDSSLGLNFVGVNYYDGQGFMVRNSMKVGSAMELNGASVCAQTGTTTELNLADFFRSKGMKYEVVAFATPDEVVKAYDAGRCEAITSDASQLYSLRLKLTNPDDHRVLPEIISKEPLGPVVRHGDDQWFDLAKWTHFAMLQAEELGISSKNVDEMMKSENPEIKRFLGVEGKFGEGFGVDNKWAYNVVKQVGNYGESFDKHLGNSSPLKIARGLNNLWNKGGIQYSAPVR
jgi:general L-amino acid transport system substrate-binding protein